MHGAPRPRACVWLSRAGRLMRADPTQLRLASRREEACQQVHDSHPMPWTARGELQKLRKGQYQHISNDNPEGEEGQWTNTPCDVQTDLFDKPAQDQQTRKRLLTKTKPENSQISHRMFASSNTETPPETEPDWSLGDTALEVHFEMKTGHHAFQKTCRDMYVFVTSAAEKVARKCVNVRCPWKKENSSIQPNRRRCSERCAGKTGAARKTIKKKHTENAMDSGVSSR